MVNSNSFCNYFKQKVEFIGGSHSQWAPKTSLPEFAFYGRSNVGKSTLLNQICNFSNIAKTSKKPGSTKTINFFKISNKFILTDLPGYGYAKLSLTERKHLSELIELYFTNRKNLKLVYLLIDSRRGLQNIDIDIIKFLYKIELGYQIVFTKTDKIKDTKLIISNCEKSLISYNDTRQYIFNSNKKNYGRKAVQLSIAKYIK